jgi:CO/xanthine dehydrogenase Mo-binding subunit
LQGFESLPDERLPLPGSSSMSVGQRIRRADAVDKVRGQALYVGDLAVAGCLHGGVLRSPHAHARILGLDVSMARSIPGVREIITARQIPGRNLVPLIQPDWPILAGEYVRHVGEGVALVAAETPEALRQALDAIVVDYEPLVAMLDMEAALAAGEVMAHFRVRRGEASVAMGRSDLVVVESTYLTRHQEHAYLEPQGMVAVPDGAGGIVVHGSLQSPFYVQRAVATALGADLARIRVVQAVTGGAFGGKDDAAALPAAQAALLAAATGRPVRLLLSREEDMAASSKRHPARVRFRLGATPDGHLFAAEVDLVMDGGAYATLSPLALFHATVHACGPYRVPNVKVDARVVRTHKVPSGAFRGLGGPQVSFACEGQMDLLAERLEMDPLELRLRNALETGDETVTGHRLDASVGLKECLSRVAESSDWERRRVLYAQDRDPVRRGIGLAAGYSGLGLGPVARLLDTAAASVVVSPDGSVTVAVGTAETGQGMATALAQITSEALGCPVERVRVLPADTSRVPGSGPTTGGRSTVMSGNAIRDAAAKIRAAMEPIVADSGLPWREAVTACVKNQVPLAAFGWAPPPPTSFDLASGQGEPYAGYTFSASVVELELDTGTGEVRVLRVHSANDVGRVVNPTGAEGQVEGSVVQGVGYALMEEHSVVDGHILNRDLSTYLIPTAVDAPEVRGALVEHPLAFGPHGAKGLADAPIVPVAPAVAAAIAHAGGIRPRELPCTAERIWSALRSKAGS